MSKLSCKELAQKINDELISIKYKNWNDFVMNVDEDIETFVRSIGHESYYQKETKINDKNKYLFFGFIDFDGTDGGCFRMLYKNELNLEDYD